MIQAASSVRRSRFGSLLYASMLTVASQASANTVLDKLADLSLEELGNVVVTSVARRAQPWSQAPASIYVITADDIRRSGATRLPEVLRLAPNLQVARVNASSYAISARGFNNALGNKLLVLIDGRTVYSPLFSGVFWDTQHVMMEDVERIEVISGPGAALWGANAVNGVINVITAPAAQTRGGLLRANASGDETGAAARLGGSIGTGSYRIYAMQQAIDASEDRSGNPLDDGWDLAQVGFRGDWGGDEANVRLQGNAYRGESDERLLGALEVSGVNLSARWQGRFADGANVRIQGYYDRASRFDPIQFRDRMQIADVEWVHALAPGTHSVLWGGGHRVARDEADPGLLVAFIPGHRRLRWSNLFVQDQIAVNDALDLTAGLKLEHNPYTGLEVLPSVRVARRFRDHDLLWGALSRAVRTPSRIDREFFLPAAPPYLIQGGPNFESEISNVAELGLRMQPGAAVTWSLTLFHHDHDRLRSGQPVAGGGFQVENRIDGTTSGIEGWAEFRLAEDWRLSAGLMWLRQQLRLKPGSLDPDGISAQGNDPDHQWKVRSTYRVSPAQEINLTLRGVDDLPDPHIPGYVTLDLQWGWQLADRFEMQLQVRDAFNASRTEFEPGLLAQASEFGREFGIKVTRSW